MLNVFWYVFFMFFIKGKKHVFYVFYSQVNVFIIYAVDNDDGRQTSDGDDNEEDDGADDDDDGEQQSDGDDEHNATTFEVVKEVGRWKYYKCS